MSFPKIPLSQKDFNTKERRELLLPHNFPPTNLIISLLPSPQLDVTRTIWRGLKTINKKKKKIEKEKLKGKNL